ncbi:MAG: protein translocase subunit SecD [Gemmatimonadota bacterium]|jgi:preprotein translocase subunit SecD|nr:protein translocase subunit SecD [Gemmatimonadota bacterium]MDQ8150584.1 protein translocase subunit SecD [Gemmatimonadota bacterium]MDQ8151495.1 protein translocase subunit SecD [Gemmatimonadota bacterium]
MQNVKSRLLVIAAMIAASVWALFPRQVVERVKRDGVFVYDTVSRVPLKRGLDLQGGIQLTLEVDQSRQTITDVSDALDRAMKVVRTRIDEFGVAEPVVQKLGNDRIMVELPGIEDPRRAEEVVQRAAFLRFQITDESQALERVVPRLDGLVKEKGLAAATDSASRPAANALGSLLQTVDSTANADTAGTSTDGPFRRSLVPGQLPGQYLVASADYGQIDALLRTPEILAALPPGKDVRWGTDSLVSGTQVYRTLYVLESRAIIDGTYLVDAKPNQDPLEGAKVDFVFNNEGGRRFRNETAKHIGDNMAIVLDDRVMSAPVIQSAIGARGQITMGGRDLQAAQDLALVLRAGALPVPLKVAEARTIGASLGEDAIRQGLLSGALGLALVVLIMVVYYRFSGVLAICGLAFYVLVTLAILAGFDATLTLPGLAGFVLSIGMAVDANFLIFERIREELDAGRSLRMAIDDGFDHAWSAIVDTHVTTALTAAILYQFGTGPVRGFAVALLAGIFASLISAIYVVRSLFLLWLSKNQTAKTLSI